MKRLARYTVLLVVLLLALPPFAPTWAQGGDEIELVPFENETFGIRGLAPDGWSAAGPGIFIRGSALNDPTSLVQQAAPGMTVAQLTGVLLPQLGLEALPESVGTYETAAFTWDLYQIDVVVPGIAVRIDLALTETDAATYIILLQTPPEDYEALHEAVFLPAVEALAPLGAEEEGEAEAAAARYEDPDGLFSAPIPTHWTAEGHEDGYGVLTAPDGELTVYLLAVEAEDMEAGVAAAWQIVDPTFDLDVEDVLESPPGANQAHAEQVVTLTYDMGDDEENIVIAGGWLYEGVAYVEIFRGTVTAVQRRQSQLAIIDTGFTIAAMDLTDLSGVEPLPLTEELIGELEEYIVAAMERFQVPGAAVAMVQGGEIVYAQGFGVRDEESGQPVTPETRMMIGSTTKTMTTLLMATLADEGLLDWDTPVVDILPTFAVADPEITARLTVENLVCACTGVPRRDFEMIFNPHTAESIIESLATFEFFTDFGEAFQYSNQMVAAGGYVAALAAGGTYGSLYDDYVALMQARIFDPIGMTATTFSFEDVIASGNYATPYSMTLSGDYVPLPLDYERAFLTPVAPAGAAWSNALDMARYVITELNEGVTPDGTRVVSAANLAHTWQPQVAITAQDSYGLGWIVSEYRGLRVLSHGGNTLGFTSEMIFLPEIDLGIVILSNQQGSLLNGAVAYRLAELIYAQPAEADAQVQFALDLIEEQLAEVSEFIGEQVDAEAVAPYLGTYHNDALGEITLTLTEDGLLMADAGEFQVEVRPYLNEESDADYITYTVPLSGLGLDFSEDDAGNPIIVIGGGVVEYTFARIAQSD